jgi:hypothetical protein
MIDTSEVHSKNLARDKPREISKDSLPADNANGGSQASIRPEPIENLGKASNPVASPSENYTFLHNASPSMP